MSKPNIIKITNGKGSTESVNGEYNVTSDTLGYDNTSISPTTVSISDEADTYDFTIAATGTLTLHVSDDGTDIGIPIAGAEFYRCDAEGTTYGDVITSDDEGNAIFNYVPYSETDTGPKIYFKQTASDGQHTFNDALQETTMEADAKTIEIENAEAPVKSFSLTDANYADLPIADGQITLSQYFFIT